METDRAPQPAGEQSPLAIKLYDDVLHLELNRSTASNALSPDLVEM